MSHGISEMFSVKETPWHKLGTVLENAPTSADAIKLAGLDWEVALENMVTTSGVNVPNSLAVVRSDGKGVVGVVGERYKPLQNIEAFNFFDAFVQAGEASYETAGSLNGGSRIWILAKLGLEPSRIVGDDLVSKFVLLSNSHDGTMAVRAGLTNVRCVCANTLAQAHASKESKLIRLRHSANVAQNLIDIRETLNLANASFEATADQYRALAKKAINQRDLRKYIIDVLDIPTDPDGKLSTRGKNIVDKVVHLSEEGVGNDVEGVRGTLWGAYNGVTEFLSYEKGSNEERRLDSLWFGASAATNEKALQYAYVMATG